MIKKEKYNFKRAKELYPVDLQLSIDLGVLAFILIEYFTKKIKEHYKNKANHINGKTWHKAPLTGIQKELPSLSINQLRHTIQKLEYREVLISGEFNEHPYDKRRSYAFTDESFLERDE